MMLLVRFLILVLITVSLSPTNFRQAVASAATGQPLPDFIGWAPDRLLLVLERHVVANLDAKGGDAAALQDLPGFEELASRFSVESLRPLFRGALASSRDGVQGAEQLARHYKVRIGRGSLEEALAAYAAIPGVAEALPIPLCGLARTPNDPLFEDGSGDYEQWALWDDFGVDADRAWESTRGAPSVLVGVIDTGVMYTHEDLGGSDPPAPDDGVTNGNIWVNPDEIPGNGIDDDGLGTPYGTYVDDVLGWDFVEDTDDPDCTCIDSDCDTQDNDPADGHGHGTHIAGIIAAITNNGLGIAGLAGGWSDGDPASAGNGVRIVPCRACWHAQLLDGRSGGVCDMSAVAEALYYLAELKRAGHNLAAVNCSFRSRNAGPVLSDAVDYLLAQDVLIVVAAGNSESGYPTDYLDQRPDCLNVAAVGSDGYPSYYTNYGSWVEIAAPGDNILSTVPDPGGPGQGGYDFMTGTSMAAPHATGAAALLEAFDPSLTAQQEWSYLLATAKPYLGSKDVGAGIVDADSALYAVARRLRLRYLDVSGSTALAYSGRPRSAGQLDFDRDGDSDLMLTMIDSYAKLYSLDHLDPEGTPVFQDVTADVIDDGSDLYDLRGISVADFDHDGYDDVFVGAASGGRLYRNVAGEHLRDDAGTLGVALASQSSYCGAWADYNRDGQPDLLIVGAAGPLGADAVPVGMTLLENRVLAGGGFADVTDAVFGDHPLHASGSAAWGDADGDGDLDLFVADWRIYSGQGTYSRLYTNHGEEGIRCDFPAFAQGLPGIAEIQGPRGVAWSDMDRDGDLDLVLPGRIYLNAGDGMFNQGGPLSFDGETSFSGVHTYDADADGLTDVLFCSSAGSSNLYVNRLDRPSPDFVPATETVGLATTYTRGMIAFDYDADGDQDLYLGRQAIYPFFYRARRDDGADSLDRPWIAVRLAPEAPANTAVGAHVLIQDPAWQVLDVVDGGGALQGQRAGRLFRGIGEVGSGPLATITWPNGHIQQVSLEPDVENLVQDDTAVHIDGASVSATYEFDPALGTIDWIIRWRTDVATWPDRDEVTVTPLVPGCSAEQDVLRSGVPGVEVTISPCEQGWQHEVRWRDRSCVPRCGYDLRIRSRTDHTDAEAAGRIVMKVCPSS